MPLTISSHNLAQNTRLRIQNACLNIKRQIKEWFLLIAIPLTAELNFYHNNPFTAPQFGIYSIEKQEQNIIYIQKNIIQNPWNKANDGQFDDDQITCCCSTQKQCELTHMVQHYGLADMLNKCSYLLVDKRCNNIVKTFTNLHIQLYKIPSIIKDPKSAIKNLIIGVSLADHIQDIHNAS